VVQEVATIRFTEVATLPGSDRGETGHGGSGGFAGNPDATTTAAIPTTPNAKD
jgi:dUTP pyrophosphatase